MRSIRIATDKQVSAKERVNEFLLLQQQKGVSETTLKQHTWALRALYNGKNSMPTEEDLRRCLPPTMGSGYYNKRLNTYRQYFAMLLSLGEIQNDPTQKFVYKKKKYRIKNYKEEDVRNFINVLDKKTFAGFRNYVMCLLILDTGVRPNELCGIRKDDFNYNTKQIVLRSEITKTRTMRVVPVSTLVANLIIKLYNYELKEWNNEFMFCSSDGKQLGSTTLRGELHKNALKTGINITPYDLRHIFATTYIRNGGDVFTLQRIMGHAKTNTTMVYVNLNPTDLSVAHSKVNVISNFTSHRITKLDK